LPGVPTTMLPPPIAPHRPVPFFAPALPPLSIANQALLASVIPPPPPEPFGVRLDRWLDAWARTLERWPAHAVSWFRPHRPA
jgi:hypothetical protein